MFDNGNFRASPFTSEVPTPAPMSYSWAVEYKIDTQTTTVEQVWEYGVNQSGENIYTSFIGDAATFDTTGDVLITFGGICILNGEPGNSLGPCSVSGRVIEVTCDSRTKVFDISVDDADPATTGYEVYRNDRINSLYNNGTVLTQFP